MKGLLQSVSLLALGLSLILILAGGLFNFSAADAEAGTTASPGSWYRAVFALPQPDISAIAARAQQLGFWIRVQYGPQVAYFHGGELCSECQPEAEASFFEFPQLYLDGELFLARLDEPRYRLIIRPSAELAGMYELLISPKVELALSELESEAYGWLDRLAIQPGSSLSFTELVPQEKPRPPEGVRLDSLLYALVVAPDWHDFAEARGLELSGLRIRVIVELAEPGVVPHPQGYHLWEEARSGELMRVLVPVSELLRLAQDPAVEFVRLPYRPHEAG